MTDTHPLAALIAGVPRYYCGNHGYEDHPQGKLVLVSDVLAALEAATPPDLVEAGKVADECKRQGDKAHAAIGATQFMRALWSAENTLRALIALATALRADRAALKRHNNALSQMLDGEEARAEAAEAEAATLRDEVERLRGVGKDAADAWEECLGHVVSALGEKPDWYGHEAGSIADFRAALEGKHE